MRKIVSLLLTAVLLATMFTVCAVSASAAEQTIDGTDITWELTENGTVLPNGGNGMTLIIDGTGDIPDFDVPISESRPWVGAANTVTTIQINSGIISLGAYSFYGFKNLTNVVIPYGVTSIGDSAFENCLSLQSVNIPSSVKNIGISAFQLCISLESLTIPYGLTSIDSYTFYRCSNLQSVTIPSSVMKIDSSAFCNCINLASITIKSSTPPVLENRAFDLTANNLLIFVPYGSANDYKQANNWSKFSEQIQEAHIVDDKPTETGSTPTKGGEGSIISEGSLVIIVGVACSVVFLAVGFFIGRKKKKPALADGTDNKDEE